MSGNAPTIRQFMASQEAASKHQNEKLEEVCERLGKVEIEIVGEVGNPAKPSIRSELKELRGELEGVKQFQSKQRARVRARKKWAAGLAASGLVAGLTAWLKKQAG